MTRPRHTDMAASGEGSHQEHARLLQAAFHSFDQAAATLQESYRGLTARLERLNLELAASNEALRVNLREKEEMRRHLAAILESLATGVIVADQQGRITRCNQAAVAFLQRPAVRLVGQELATVMASTGLDQQSYPTIAPSGALLSVNATRLQAEPGQTDGFIVLLHDVSTIHELEVRMQRRDRLAAMGEMVGRIAHEIRNPLGSIELFASLLRRDLAEQDRQRTYAEHISAAVQALNRLLSNLLMYTRPDRPQAAWHETELLLTEAMTLTTHAIARAPIRISFHVDGEVPAIWCDASQIKQVLVNLILNSVQAMPDGGTILISVARDSAQASGPSRIRLEISDNGHGIDPELRSRIFDPFFTTKSDGTGLGLAIVHAIIESHRGRIELESQQGQGTVFRIYLPAAPPVDGAPERFPHPTGDLSAART